MADNREDTDVATPRKLSRGSITRRPGERGSSQYTAPFNDGGAAVLAPSDALVPPGVTDSNEYVETSTHKLTLDIAEMRKDYVRLREERAASERDKKEAQRSEKTLRAKYDELLQKERFYYLLSNVNSAAKLKLFESEKFRQTFDETETCEAFVVSLDIRRSTELMLKARSAKHFS